MLFSSETSEAFHHHDGDLSPAACDAPVIPGYEW